MMNHWKSRDEIVTIEILSKAKSTPQWRRLQESLNCIYQNNG